MVRNTQDAAGGHPITYLSERLHGVSVVRQCSKPSRQLAAAPEVRSGLRVCRLEVPVADSVPPGGERRCQLLHL